MNDEVLLVFPWGCASSWPCWPRRSACPRSWGPFSGRLPAGGHGPCRAGGAFGDPLQASLRGRSFFVSVGFMVQPAMIAQYIGPILLLLGGGHYRQAPLPHPGGPGGGAAPGGLPACGGGPDPGGGVLLHSGRPGAVPVGDGAFLYPVIVAVSVITTFTTPFLLRLAGPLQRGAGAGPAPTVPGGAGPILPGPGTGEGGDGPGLDPVPPGIWQGLCPVRGPLAVGSSSWGQQLLPCWGLAGAPGGGWRSC